MSPFLAVDSGTDSIRGQFVEHLLMLSTWAACGRVGEPFPDHHLSLDPVPGGNLCSTQDPEIDARSLEDACNPFFFSRPISDCTQSLYLIAHLWSRNTQYVNLWSEPISLTPRGQAPARFAERRGGLLTLLSDSEQLSIKLMVQPPRLKKSWQALKRSEPAIAIYFAGYKSTSNPTASSSSPTFDYSLPSSLVRRKHVTFYDFHDHDWNFWVNFVRIWTNWGLSTPQLRRPRILSGWLTHFEII